MERIKLDFFFPVPEDWENSLGIIGGINSGSKDNLFSRGSRPGRTLGQAAL